MQDNKQHNKKYIINGNALKEYYQKQYLDDTEEDCKCIFKESIQNKFPKFIVFGLDTLEWEPIKLSLTENPIRADTPDALHQHWSKSNRVPQDNPVSVIQENQYINIYDYEAFMLMSKRPLSEKLQERIIKNHALNCYQNIARFNENQINLLYSNLESQDDLININDEDKKSSICHSSCCYSYNTEKRDSNIVMDNKTPSWITDIDNYILNIINGKTSANFNDSYLRVKLEIIIQNHAPLIATLILRRIIGLCKVKIIMFLL